MEERLELERRTIDVEIERGVNQKLRADSRALALKLKNRGSYSAFCRDVLLAWRTLGLAAVAGALIAGPSGLYWMANSKHTGCYTKDSLCYELQDMRAFFLTHINRWF